MRSVHAEAISPARAMVLTALLASVAGGIDVLCFVRLGHVFGSVMTGNVVLAGISLGDQSVTTFASAACAIAAYAVGAVAGGWLIRSIRSPSEPEQDHGIWPVWATLVFAAELLLLCAFTVLWLTTSAAPAGAVLYLTLAFAAAAMGMQSVGFQAVRLPGVSTTYFTGTLTHVVTGLVIHRRLNHAAGLAILGLAIGATVVGVILVDQASWAAAYPVILLSAVVGAAVFSR